MTQKEVTRKIRAMYRPLLRGAHFRVEPFIISKADHVSGCYSVTVLREFHTILMATVWPHGRPLRHE